MVDEVSARLVLQCPMDDNPADAATIQDYFSKLLLRLWQYGENFSGKRPFGHSFWESDLHRALVRNGLIDGRFDEDDCLDYLTDEEQEKADELIRNAIQYLGACE